MRISSLYNSDAMMAQLGVNGTRMSKLMEQMATQKRINVPSDDPVAATRLVQLNREQSAIQQYQSNISRLSGSLSSQEAHVTAMSNQLLSLNDKLLAAANGDTHSSEDMVGFGNELSSMLDSLVASINAQNENGSYLFSGTKTDAKPVVWDEAQGKYIYQGNDGTRETTVANGVNVTENTNVVQAFGNGTDLEMLNKLKALSEKMQDPSIPVSDYQDDMNEMLSLSSDTRDKVAAQLTDLGGRQNRLTMLGDAHTDVSTANDQVVRDLSDTDWATTSINLQLYTNSVQVTNKAYSMISQLSLFSML
ncbi:MAG TPA: flagellar hook-associated protein FlgL [Lelliottia sp.]